MRLIDAPAARSRAASRVARRPAGERRLAGLLGGGRFAGGRWRLWHRRSGVGQLVNDLTRGAAAAAPRPAVHREHTRGGRRVGTAPSRADPAQQRVRAGVHGPALGPARTGLAAECEADVALQAAQPFGPARRDRCDARQALGKGLARAGRGEAAEPPRQDAQRHGPTLPGQVAEGAFVSAVDVLGRRATTRAEDRRGRRRGENGDVVRSGQDLHDGQACRDQRQQVLG